MGSIKRTNNGQRQVKPGCDLRLKRYRDTNPSNSTKESFINGDDLELFDNSIKRLCSYLSGSEEESNDDDEHFPPPKADNNFNDENVKNGSCGRRRRMNRKNRTFQRKSSCSNSINVNNNNNKNDKGLALEMASADEFNGEKLYLPRPIIGERRLLPQDFLNIPPPAESPETERRRHQHRCPPPSLTLPPVPTIDEAQYEEAKPPSVAPRLSKQKSGPVLCYGATSSINEPVYVSQGCQYQYNDIDLDVAAASNNFDCQALQRNETGSFYIPSSGQTTMSTISPSRKSENDQNRHNNYSLASNAAASRYTVPPPVLPIRPDGGGPPQKFKRIKNNKHHQNNNHKNKKSSSRISWRIFTYALVVCLLFSLAVISYLLGKNIFWNNLRETFITLLTQTSNNLNGDEIMNVGSSSNSNYDFSSTSSSSAVLRPLPESFDVGETIVVDLTPNLLKRTYFNLQRNSYVQFNMSIESRAKLAIFGRKTLPPSYTQYDFTQIIFGSKLHSSSGGISKRETKINVDHNMRTTTFDHYLLDGRWHLAFLNDDPLITTVRFSTHLIEEENKECKFNCYEKGVCRDGKCNCFNGYTGVYCEETLCPVACSGNGILQGGRCSCHQFWKGNECDVPSNVCEVPDCNNNGQCNWAGECECNPGYGGKFCERRECASTNCSNHGVCVDGRCYCEFGWQGDACDIAYTSQMICASASVDQCSSRGVFDVSTSTCACERGFEGVNCEKSICALDCGLRGRCDEKHICTCDDGWTGERCDLIACPSACNDHGACQNGSCVCEPGWNGDLCLLDGCPENCNNRGRCLKTAISQWSCVCNADFAGLACQTPLEMECSDKLDNDNDGLVDCEDSECCSHLSCNSSSVCQSVPDPHMVLIRTTPPPPHSSFYDKVKFLLDAGSLQQYPGSFNRSRASVIRGRIVNSRNASLVGVRIADALNALDGFTLSRAHGFFDVMVNGGGSVSLQFMRVPLVSLTKVYRVGWNEILYVDDVVMTSREIVNENNNGKELTEITSSESCATAERIHNVQPTILTSWTYASLGANYSRAGVVADARIVQDSIRVPGTEIYLVYSSVTAAGHDSTLLIYLVPERYPLDLRLVRTKIDVEGVRVERTFEARPNLTYTFGWDKRNVYRQKVYGLTSATVSVAYFYKNCPTPFVDVQKIKLSGFRSSISDLGGWNLHIHHRYDVVNGVLEKGDGSAVYTREEQPMLTNLLGQNGKQRSLTCLLPSAICDDVSASDATLFSPVALAASRNGSLFVGDYNLIRKLTYDGHRLKTLLELSVADASHLYYLAVHPLTSDLYVSLPLRRQIWRIRTGNSLKNMYDVAVGTGESCTSALSYDETCGDDGSAEEAKLNFPKGIAFDSQGSLYIADERKIRKVSPNGFMSTILDGGKTIKSSSPQECRTNFASSDVQLYWPTSLAVDPVDDRLLFLDDDKVYKLQHASTLKLIAGAPTHCSFLTTPTNETVRPSTLKNAAAIAVTSDGKLVVSETDGRRLNRIRSFFGGRPTLLAGIESACRCSKNCPCDDVGDVVVAAQARLFRPISLAVDESNVVHVADNGNFKIRSLKRFETKCNATTNFRHCEIISPSSSEIYVFNRHGQHVATKNFTTNLYVHNFSYHLDAPHGALVQISSSDGARLIIQRKDRRTIKLENDNGTKSVINLNPFHPMLQQFTDVERQTTRRFAYRNGDALLVARTDATTNRSWSYAYDEFGRAKTATTPDGDVYTFDSDVFRNVLLSTVTKNDAFYRRYSVTNNEINFSSAGDSNEKRTIFLQDSTNYHLRMIRDAN